MEKMQLQLQIDGRSIEAAEGQTILEAARANGIFIPTLCFLERAEEPRQPCLMCLVEIDGMARARACKTPVQNGMVVQSKTKELEQFRKERLQALATTHYGDCRAPCNLTCPGGINVQGYVNLIANGEYEAAWRLIRERNPLPVSVGRVCPRFCETRCRRVLVDEPIGINNLKRFVGDYALEHGFKDDLPEKETGRRVAVIGGGPAGLSCAYYLRKKGHEVVIFDANERLGGALRYWIPGYKLPKKQLDREIQGILKLGIHVKRGQRWGDHFNLQSLKEQGFEAFFIATGLSKQKSLDVEGAELAWDGLQFLRQANEQSVAFVQEIQAKKRILVIGGGDVAVDVARSARRLGAESVTVIYSRSRVEMSAQQRDVQEAEKEGVQFFLMATPLKIHGDEGSGAVKVEMARTILSEPDEKGIRQPVPMPGSRLFWNGDLVISALGQEGDATFKSYGEIEASIAVTSKNTIKSNPSTMATNVPGVFAGGDVATGPRSVIQAVAAGRRAADAIHEFLMRPEQVFVSDSRFNFSKGKRFEEVDLHNFDGASLQLSEQMPARSPERRIHDFDEVELGLSEEMARREAQRCLQCGCLGLSKCSYRDLAVRYKVDTGKAPHRLHRTIKKDHPFILVDANKCVGCSRCERSCKYNALELKLVFNPDTSVLEDSSITITENCVSCGACVDACPTGALSKKGLAVPLFPEEVQKVSSVCTYCGTGCSVDVVVNNKAILEMRADKTLPPNWGDLCVKGRFGYTFYRHADRLTVPLVRDSLDEPFRETDWVEAIGLVASRFERLIRDHGPNSVGILSSSRCTNEENYLLQKLARAVWLTNNVDNCARV